MTLEEFERDGWPGVIGGAISCGIMVAMGFMPWFVAIPFLLVFALCWRIWAMAEFRGLPEFMRRKAPSPPKESEE